MPESDKKTDRKGIALAESQIQIGSEIKQVRKVRRETLKSLSQATGISVSHLSAIERGAANPSLSAISRVAEALRISPDWFFARRTGEGPMERAYVVRSNNRRELNSLYGEISETLGFTDEILSSSIGGDFLMGVATYEPHSSRPDHSMYQHEGEQHGFILKGALELLIGDETILLHEGDSYSFPTRIIHNARNSSDRSCQLIWAISPIVIPRDVVVSAEAAQR